MDPRLVFQLRDINRTARSARRRAGRHRRRRDVNDYPVDHFYLDSETRYFDFDGDGKLSDDERDEDADGLTNYDEAHGPHDARLLGRLLHEGEAVPDRLRGHRASSTRTSDGDGVRDGADDQDHDDIPNVMELSRNAASGRMPAAICSDKDAVDDAGSAEGRRQPVQPVPPVHGLADLRAAPLPREQVLPVGSRGRRFYQVLN